MLLEPMQSIAKNVFMFRKVGFVLALICMSLFGYSLMVSTALSERMMLLSFVGFLWLIMLLAVAYTFSEIPAKPDKKMPFFRRQWRKLKRTALSLYALIFIAVSVAVLLLSVRLIILLIRPLLG